MKLVAIHARPVEHVTPLLGVPLFEKERQLSGAAAEIDRALGGEITRLLEIGDFRAREGQTLVLYPRAEGVAAERVALIGLGSREKFDLERVRRASATLVRQAEQLGVDRASGVWLEAAALPDGVSVEDAARAAAEGAVLAGFTFDELKSTDEDDEAARRGKPASVEFLLADSDPGVVDGAIRTGDVLARGENFARRLGNLPGNIATPSFLAEQARGIAERHGMQATILGRDELEAEGLNALLAVSRGSDQEPYLIVLEHRRGGVDQRPLVLVGKGLTFDSGGISIKPAPGMEEMKFDMSGGAAVLGAMDAIGELGLETNVVAIVPTSENLLSGSAMKPGDIIRAHSGKTIEVVNTDAEGRLILADALSYAARYEPAAIVDAATLTGACVIALGHHASGALTNDEALLEEVRAAGERVHERVWPLPMYDEYREQLRSDYADLKNTGGRPAGTITGAWFLREFVGDTPWVHLDIAGTANGDGKLPYQRKGSTGAPARLLVEWVRSRAD